jgi:outer membrane protein OmpA-like peptidoglycan-associated protein
MAIVVAVAAPGCASKKYVSRQINQVNQQNAQYHKDTNGKIAWLNNQQKTDMAQVNNQMAQVNDRMAATDQRVAEANETAQRAAAESARGTAARSAEITAIMTRPPNYQLVDRTDVLFAFDKSTLSTAAKSSLDKIVARVQESPSAVVELAGFTDRVGSPYYNLDLSRRRAWAVQRYLIEHNVPARSIHTVGLGQENAPQGMEGGEKVTAKAAHHKGSDYNPADRRVNIRVFAAGEASGASSNDIEQ